MKLPPLQPETTRSRQMIVEFGGINYGQEPRDGELVDSIGLTSSKYPYLAQRMGRGNERTYDNPSALHASKQALCVVEGTSFIYNGELVQGSVLTPGEKTMVSIGQRVIIFPDKKFYDFSTGVFGNLEEKYTSGTGQITFTANTLSTTGPDFKFRAGDAVEISGCTAKPENNKTIIIRSVAPKVLTFYQESFAAAVEPGVVRIERNIPALTNLCEANNRLWGTVGQEIRGSALGDPFNWNKYDGLSTDSYAVVVGTPGDFTGCALYANQICFFKEDCIHKLFGTRPANFEVTTVSVPGVQANCARSIAIINEIMLYKSRTGVYAYNGGIPQLISNSFGTRRFFDARAVTDGTKYYISMRDDREVWYLFAYDPTNGIWLKEENAHVLDFGELSGTVYYIQEGDGVVRSMDITTSEERVEWLAELAPFTEVIHERKGYSKISARIDLDAGTYLHIEVKTDSSPWETVYTVHRDEPGTVNVPIKPNRCDSFSVRFRGRGGFLIKSMLREFTIGSEV